MVLNVIVLGTLVGIGIVGAWMLIRINNLREDDTSIYASNQRRADKSPSDVDDEPAEQTSHRNKSKCSLKKKVSYETINGSGEDTEPFKVSFVY
jgi:hypothetical protein